MEQTNIFFTDPEDHDQVELSSIQLKDEDVQRFEQKFGFTKAQIKQFLEAFSVFDLNCDGLITSSELGQVMTELGHRPSLQELETLIRGVDIDKDGCVSFEEFLRMRCAKMDQHPETELREVFDVMDLDQDGVISMSDLHTILTKLGEGISKVNWQTDKKDRQMVPLLGATNQEEAEEMVNMADFNADGVVDFKEFQEMLHAK